MTAGGTGGPKLGLIKVGLESGLQNIKRSSYNCGSHASDAVYVSQLYYIYMQVYSSSYTYPPATRCGHDFEKGDCLVVEGGTVVGSGTTPPSSRDCDSGIF